MNNSTYNVNFLNVIKWYLLDKVLLGDGCVMIKEFSTSRVIFPSVSKVTRKKKWQICCFKPLFFATLKMSQWVKGESCPVADEWVLTAVVKCCMAEKSSKEKTNRIHVSIVLLGKLKSRDFQLWFIPEFLSWIQFVRQTYEHRERIGM